MGAGASTDDRVYFTHTEDGAPQTREMCPELLSNAGVTAQQWENFRRELNEHLREGMGPITYGSGAVQCCSAIVCCCGANKDTSE